MDKERAIIFIKNKILDLRDDLDHEECVEQDELLARKIRWEIGDYKNVLEILTTNREDFHNNAINFIWDKISVIEDSLSYEKDKVRKYMLECDLKEYSNIKDCLLWVPCPTNSIKTVRKEEERL